jgi:hypothetical protein
MAFLSSNYSPRRQIWKNSKTSASKITLSYERGKLARKNSEGYGKRE